MQRPSVGGIASNSIQPVASQKRAWNQPSITDEDAKDTAAKSSSPAETPTTDGPPS